MSTETETGLLTAASAGVRDMADGTLRIFFDFEPRDAQAAFKLFAVRGTQAIVGKYVEPTARPAPTPAPPPATKRQRMAALCEWAVLRCAEPRFQQFCMDLWEGGEVEGVNPAQFPGQPQEFAKAMVCQLCGVLSRKELDTQPEAGKRFHESVMRPYATWLQVQGVEA